MKRTIFALVALICVATTLVACAPIQNTAPDVPNAFAVQAENIDNVRAASQGLANQFAAELSTYRKTHTADETIAVAEAATAHSLKDPDSAKFRGTRLTAYNGGVVVCGQVNAKNSYGGYTGYKDFVAGTSGGIIRAATIDGDVNIANAAAAGIDIACEQSAPDS